MNKLKVQLLLDKRMEDLQVGERATLYTVSGDIECDILSSEIERRNLILNCEVNNKLFNKLKYGEDTILSVINLNIIQGETKVPYTYVSYTI